MFRLCSECSVMFRLCSEYSVMFSIVQNLFSNVQYYSESGIFWTESEHGLNRFWIILNITEQILNNTEQILNNNEYSEHGLNRFWIILNITEQILNNTEHYWMFSIIQNLFSPCSEYPVLFRICSVHVQTLFRIFSNVQYCSVHVQNVQNIQ
jgi:hypothetical protein